MESALWREVVSEVAADYPDVELRAPIPTSIQPSST